jgi:hypothetical protein
MSTGRCGDAEKMTDLPGWNVVAWAMLTSEQDGLGTDSEGQLCRLFFEQSTT